MFDAATDPAQTAVGVVDERASALERVRFALDDLASAPAEIIAVPARMLTALSELELTSVVASIPG